MISYCCFSVLSNVGGLVMAFLFKIPMVFILKNGFQFLYKANRSRSELLLGFKYSDEYFVEIASWWMSHELFRANSLSANKVSKSNLKWAEIEVINTGLGYRFYLSIILFIIQKENHEFIFKINYLQFWNISRMSIVYF